jgi:hypothetical protein
VIKKTYKNGEWTQDGEPCDPPPSRFTNDLPAKVQAQWPIYSEAAGVHPDQINEAKDNLQKQGVPTDFTPDGRLIFRDRMHRRKVLKAMGLVDRSSYYGY